MESCQVNVTICRHIITTLHTILVLTRNFATARLSNNIFALLPYLSGKAKAIEPPFCTKEIGKDIKGNCFDKDCTGMKRRSSPPRILAKVVKDTQQQLNPANVVVPDDFVAIILWLPSLPYAFGAASYSSSNLSRLPSSLSPLLFV